MPVPYNLEFELYIMAKQSDDALQIVEQILPIFNLIILLLLMICQTWELKRCSYNFKQYQL